MVSFPWLESWTEYGETWTRDRTKFVTLLLNGRHNVTSSPRFPTFPQHHDGLPLKSEARINPFSFVSLIRIFYQRDRTNREYTWVVSSLGRRWIVLLWMLIETSSCVWRNSVLLDWGCLEELDHVGTWAQGWQEAIRGQTPCITLTQWADAISRALTPDQ